jgi:hypothetical protein
MLITCRYLIQKSSIIRTTVIYCSYRYQTTDSSLASILFPEPKAIDKNENPSPSVKSTTKQQAQAVVSSAADVAANALGVGWGALTAVSNRITGLTGATRKISIPNEQLQSTGRFVTPESLQQRTISLIRSVQAASSTLSQATRIEELSKHLLQHPDANYFTKKVFLLFLRINFRKKTNKFYLIFRNVSYLIYYFYEVKNVINLFLIKHFFILLMNV